MPYARLNDKMLNAFAYLDHSIGEFIAAFRQTPAWKNTLIVILPDHGVTWPADINEFDIRKYHIPLIWTGGAVRAPRVVTKLCKPDGALAATLLGKWALTIVNSRSPETCSRKLTHIRLLSNTWPEGYTLLTALERLFLTSIRKVCRR